MMRRADLGFWGSSLPVKEGSGPGTGSAAEGVAADADGNVYGAEVDARKLMRYVKN